MRRHNSIHMLHVLAIERAMAYVDTGELPWDMQLFDNTREVRNSTLVHYYFISNVTRCVQSTSVYDVRNEEEEPTDEQKLAATKFYEELKRFQDERGKIHLNASHSNA